MGNYHSKHARKESSILAEHKDTKEVPKLPKVLLRGTGDSGKSTVFKQMRLAHGLSFTPWEVESYRQLVFSNITSGISQTIDATQALWLDFPPMLVEDLRMVTDAPDLKDGQTFPTQLGEAIFCIWAAPSVQDIVRSERRLVLSDNLPYFMYHILRIFKPGYSPTDTDILHTRTRTVGLDQTVFDRDPGTVPFRLFDVGGARSERRKWIHCLHHSVAIIYVLSLAGFDNTLLEDKNVNQMTDALDVWDILVENRALAKATFVLFLNKWDLFEGAHIFQERCLKSATKAGRVVYPHITTATDRKVMQSVLATIERILDSNTADVPLL